MADADGPKHWDENGRLVTTGRMVAISNDALAVVDRLTSLIAVVGEISRTLGRIEKELEGGGTSLQRVADGTK